MSVLSMMLAFLMVPAAKLRDDRVLALEQENKSLKTQIAALQGGHATDQITIATYREIARQQERSIEIQRGLAQYWQSTARSLVREPEHQQQRLAEQFRQAQALAQYNQNHQPYLGLQAVGGYFDCTCVPDRASMMLGSVEERASRGALTGADLARMAQFPAIRNVDFPSVIGDVRV